MGSELTATTDSQGFTVVTVSEEQARLDSEDWMVFFQGIVDYGSRGVIIDCQQVMTPSSPFMGALAWSRRVFQQAGFDVCIIGCHGKLDKALEVTDLKRVLLFAEGTDSARRQLCAE